MKKLIFSILGMLLFAMSYSQVTEQHLVTIHALTNAQMLALTPSEGALVYNTTDKTLYAYNGAQWVKNNSDDQAISSAVVTANQTVQIALEDGGTTNIDIRDGDADNQNELTDLRLSGNTLTLSNPATGTNSVDLSSLDETVVSTDANNDITIGSDGGAYLNVAASSASVYTGYFIIDNTTLTTAAGTYEQTISGLPFQPSQITFVAHPNIGAFDINDDNALGANNTGLLENTFGTMNGFARAGTPITQAVIFSGGSGSSINNISRYSNDAQCIGIRYTNSNGDNNGVISAALKSFETDGFKLDVTYTFGTVGNANQRNDILDESVIVLYTAYK